jgi:hypothetical protein
MPNVWQMKRALARAARQACKIRTSLLDAWISVA